MTKTGWKFHEGLVHLSNVDPALKLIIESTDIPNKLSSNTNTNTNTNEISPFNALLKSIMYQQLAGAAARSIYNKFCEALHTTPESIITPEMVNSAVFSTEEVGGKNKVVVNGKVPGLSQPKSKYIRSLAEHFTDETKLKNVDFHAIPEDELFSKLLSVNGLGAWSIHMFMMFHLHSQDILPTGDLAVRKGVCNLYNLPLKSFEKGKTGEKEKKERCKHWSPYSTLASLYMWKISSTKVME